MPQHVPWRGIPLLLAMSLAPEGERSTQEAHKLGTKTDQGGTTMQSSQSLLHQLSFLDLVNKMIFNAQSRTGISSKLHNKTSIYFQRVGTIWTRLHERDPAHARWWRIDDDQ